MELKRVDNFPHEIMFDDGEYSISISMPTYRNSGDWKQDRTRFRNLVTKIENSLLDMLDKAKIDLLLDPIYKILEDPYFWNTMEKGLVVLLNENQGIYYILNREIEEYVSVSNEFYIRPLIRNYQSYDKYQVLGLSKEEFVLYEGTRYSLEPIHFNDDIITNKSDLIDQDDRKKVLNFGTYTGNSYGLHGHDTKEEGIQNETTYFFRYVDNFILENFSKINHTPLILISLTENQGEFRRISKNDYLLEMGINKSFSSINESDLNDEIWKVIEPIYLEKTANLIEKYKQAQAESRASMDILEIAHGLTDGRVDTLIVESNKFIPGTYNVDKRQIEAETLNNSCKGDLVNQLSLMTFNQNGNVIVLPPEKFPEKSGCIAIFRY